MTWLEGSIETAVAESIERFGSIDALVNNAGYGAFGPLEATSHEKIVRQFETNVIGLLDTTEAVIPHFRRQRHGTIINVSSIGGRLTFPLGTLYHGSKWAVEQLSEALSFEMQAIGVRVKVVEPGVVNTDFGGRSFDYSSDEALEEYKGIVDALENAMSSSGTSSEPVVVAEVIYQAVTDDTNRLRYTAGDDAAEMLANRTAAGDEEFLAGMKAQFGVGNPSTQI